MPFRSAAPRRCEYPNNDVILTQMTVYLSTLAVEILSILKAVSFGHSPGATAFRDRSEIDCRMATIEFQKNRNPVHGEI
jgi:hypothetical protein